MSKEKTLTELLTEARHAKGLTQVAVAEKAGIYSNTYAKIERGEQLPNPESLMGLSKTLDIDPGVLLDAWTRSKAKR